MSSPSSPGREPPKLRKPHSTQGGLEGRRLSQACLEPSLDDSEVAGLGDLRAVSRVWGGRVAGMTWSISLFQLLHFSFHAASSQGAM